MQVLQQAVLTKEDITSEGTASLILQSFMESRLLGEQASLAQFLSLLTPSARLLSNLLRYLQVSKTMPTVSLGFQWAGVQVSIPGGSGNGTRLL